MSKPIHIYENLLWDVLDDESKLYILTIMIKNEFNGECKLTSTVRENSTVIVINDEEGKYLVLPIDILKILND